MTDRDECRIPTCSDPARDQVGYAGRFCTDSREVRYEHLQADARDIVVDESKDRY